MSPPDIASGLQALASIAHDTDFHDLAKRADEVRTRLQFDRVHLVVVGEFNRGKTTFVNALIGEPLLPMDIVPTTATIWTIEQSPSRRAMIVFRDGREEEIDPSAASLARLSAEGDFCRPEIRYVRISVPHLAIGDDVVVIDTPGVNDINEQRSEVTYGFLGKADAAVFLMDASSPVTRSEAQFLQGQVLESSLRKLLFVANKIDRIDPDEILDALDSAKERLHEILGRPAKVVACDASRILSAFSASESCSDDAERALMSVLVRSDPRRRELAERWGWRDLRAGLDELLAESRSSDVVARTATDRFHALIRQLRERLETRRALGAQATSELSASLARFESDRSALAARFERFVENCHVHGRDRIKLMVEQSLQHAAREFLEREAMRVSTMRGDFRAYAEKVLPYEIQIMVKRWFEAKIPEIERFLGELSSHVAQDYRRAFGGVFGFGDALRVEASRGPAPATMAVEDVSEYYGVALPAVGALAVGLLIAGPFLLVGAAAGGFIAKRIHASQTETLRDRILLELPNVVDAAIEPPVAGMGRAIDAWFTSLDAALRRQFESDTALRQADLERATDARPEARASVVQSTDAALAALDDLAITFSGGLT